MKFLLRDVFYPERKITDNGEIECVETDNKLISEQYKLYSDYLGTIKNKFPKQLFKFYQNTNGFHDYYIKNILYSGDALCYKRKSDKVCLELVFNNIEYMIEFDSISYFKLLNTFKQTSLSFLDCEKYRGMESILMCEINLVSDNMFAFEFFTGNDAVFEVHFNKVKITKRTAMF